jgi:hypothetical protein
MEKFWVVIDEKTARKFKTREEAENTAWADARYRDRNAVFVVLEATCGFSAKKPKPDETIPVKYVGTAEKSWDG